MLKNTFIKLNSYLSNSYYYFNVTATSVVLFFPFYDAAVPKQLSFQMEASPNMLGIVAFHNDLSFVLAIVSGFTLVILLRMIFLFSVANCSVDEESKLAAVKVGIRPFQHHTALEVVWTSIPIIILLLVAGPSLSLLYSSDELIDPRLTVKVIGHQWYWTYEMSDAVRFNPVPSNPAEFFEMWCLSAPSESAITEEGALAKEIDPKLTVEAALALVKDDETREYIRKLSFKSWDGVVLYYMEHFSFDEFVSTTVDSALVSFVLDVNPSAFEEYYDLMCFSVFEAYSALLPNLEQILLDRFVSDLPIVAEKWFEAIPDTLFPIAEEDFEDLFIYSVFETYKSLLNPTINNVDLYNLFADFVLNNYSVDQLVLTDEDRETFSFLLFSLLTENKKNAEMWATYHDMMSSIIHAFAVQMNPPAVAAPSEELEPRVWEWGETADLSGLDYVFDSYMVPESDLSLGQLRLLETTQSLVLPTDVQIRFLVTSSDVLHSWAVPSLGIKIDACPGRLNQVGTRIFRRGVFYGQCSEICGINHGFMPIQIEAIGLPSFRQYFAENYVVTGVLNNAA